MAIGMTAVDEEKLARVLGFNEWPSELLNTEARRMAARVITDTYQKPTAEIAISNAEAWIKYAYKDGVDEGIRQERGRWKSRISELFQLDK